MLTIHFEMQYAVDYHESCDNEITVEALRIPRTNHNLLPLMSAEDVARVQVLAEEAYVDALITKVEQLRDKRLAMGAYRSPRTGE